MCEGLYIIRILKDLGFYDINFPMKSYEDNQPTIHMITADQLVHATTKHITPKFHFVRDLYLNKTIAIAKIATENNIADLLTKALSVHVFNKFSEQILNHYH